MGEAVAMQGRLTEAQVRVLATLAPVHPRWTLTGGGALAGFHLQHRTTRDLDLFWHGLSAFTREPEDCIQRLEGAGFATHVIQRSAGFVRLRAELAGEAVVIDLVAEPVPCIEPPDEVAAANTKIRIDSAYEILVNKLGTLLHRAELRDLVDLQALLDHGGDLGRALRDASRKDGGFSPVMVGYLLQGFPLERQAKVAGLDAAATTALDRFRVELIGKIAKLSQP